MLGTMLHRLKGGGFRVRLKAGSVRLRRTPSRHLKVIIRLWRTLVFYVFRPDLICHVTAARNPVTSCPEVLPPVPFAQAGKLCKQLMRATPLQVLDRPRHRKARWYREQQMHVVTIDRPGMNDHLVCTRRLAHQLPAPLPHIPAEDREPVFRNPYNVVLAVPDRMAAAFVALHDPVYTGHARVPCRLKAWGFLIPYRGL